MADKQPGANGNPAADPRFYAQGGHILIGGSDAGIEYIELKLANRHGLVTGATGTGKTVTLQVLAEGFSAAGVPVFAADIKGDLSGIGAAGEPKPNLVQRAEEIGLAALRQRRLSGRVLGHFRRAGPSRARTVQEMGPLLLSRLLELTEPQEGVLNIAFRWAEDERKAGDANMVDPRSAGSAGGHRRDGQAAPRAAAASTATSRRQTVGVIQRRLLVLEEQGADKFFGEPALDINDFLKHGARRARRHQHSRRREADEYAAPLRHVPAVDAVRAVRKAARSRRSR